MEDVRRIVVVVEDKEAARTALQWALHNFLRQGDVIVLLHVFSSLPRKKKSTAARLLRRHGYHLALSFREICDSFFNVSKISLIMGKKNSTLLDFLLMNWFFLVNIRFLRDRCYNRRIRR